MKRLFFCFSALLFVGCMPISEPEISASQLAAMPENQTLHYRPVHRNHEDWSISQLGKTLTIHADKRIKLNVRRNPNRVLIRENGNIIGHIESTQNSIHYIPALDEQPQNIEFHCLSHKNAQLSAHEQLNNYQMTETGAVNNDFELTKQTARRRYSIATRHDPNANTESCNGTELESPFSPFGTLIFHTDTLPLAPRAGLAWYLTYFNISCE